MGLAARDRAGERRLVEMFRAEREQRKAVVDASPVGVCAFDRAGNLAVSNATADDLLGVRLASYLGRSFRRLLIDMTRLGALERIGLHPATVRTLLDDLKRDPLEAVHRHFDPVVAGQRRHYQMSIFPLQGARGARAGWFVMLRDVTEGVARDAMRSEILDMIVHDLRSPLNSILGNLYLMQAMLEDGTSAHELQAVLHEAKGSAATMMQLIESMLDVKKLKHGRMALNLSAVSLHDVAAKACEIMEVLAREANLTLETAIAWDIPLVLADPTALQRVLVNLLDNAIRYTPEGGRIRLAARLKGEQVEVSVTDAGPGIPPEMRARVFEKYVQAHRPSLRGRGTAGLGLAFCRLVVQEQGGDIWAMEGPEGGAAIVFTLPVDPEACMAPASPE